MVKPYFWEVFHPPPFSIPDFTPTLSFLNPILPRVVESSESSPVPLLLNILSVRETVWAFIEIWSVVFTLKAGLPRGIPV